MTEPDTHTHTHIYIYIYINIYIYIERERERKGGMIDRQTDRNERDREIKPSLLSYYLSKIKYILNS